MVSNEVKISLYGAASIVLLTIANVLESASYLSLVAIIPIIIILKNSLSKKTGYWQWPVSLTVTLTVTYLLGQLITSQSISFGILPYAVGLSLVTSLYWLVSRHLNSRIGLFTVILFWLAYDYLILSVFPDNSVYFVFNSLETSAFLPWTHSLGFFGVTLWALVSNFLMAYILFDPNTEYNIKMRWLSLIYATLFITAPIWILYFWPSSQIGISFDDMYRHYHDLPIDNLLYNERGEWLGRTSAWVAVLIVIYSLVKRKVKK